MAGRERDGVDKYGPNKGHVSVFYLCLYLQLFGIR